jgi:predicted small lipoprotein YifL
MTVRFFLVAFVLGLALTGCGRKGNPLPPPGYEKSSQQSIERNKSPEQDLPPRPSAPSGREGR